MTFISFIHYLFIVKKNPKNILAILPQDVASDQFIKLLIIKPFGNIYIYIYIWTGLVIVANTSRHILLVNSWPK